MGHVTCIGEKGSTYRVLVRQSEGKRPCGRPKCRWDDNIKINLQEVGFGRRAWTGMIWLRLGTGGRHL